LFELTPLVVAVLKGYLLSVSPAVAEITGAGLERTVWTISELSMPYR
jgi:hypothetical protein